jgi:hypothetical protein
MTDTNEPAAAIPDDNTARAAVLDSLEPGEGMRLTQTGVTHEQVPDHAIQLFGIVREVAQLPAVAEGTADRTDNNPTEDTR